MSKTIIDTKRALFYNRAIKRFVAHMEEGKMTLEQALERIRILEEENRQLKEELKKYENRNRGGRHPHDEKWQQGYRKFVDYYTQGMTIVEIVNQGEISRRTAYRYKAYYDQLQKAITNNK